MELQPNYLIIKHATFPLPNFHPGEPQYDEQFRIPCAKVMGGARGRAKAFRPASVINVSGMSFGSLSGPAVEALNRGAAIAGCLQSTGEGGVSSYHLKGGDLIWQVGTAYFGCREPDGRFSMARLKDTIGWLSADSRHRSEAQSRRQAGCRRPAASREDHPGDRRDPRHPLDRDCVSPAAHSMFRDADGLLDFAESIAAETGLPVGIKSAVGDLTFWEDLARLMEGGGRGLDFITIDGGEGGTGAGPLVFTDHVALPFKVGFSRVVKIFTARGLHERVVFAGAGKLGFPEATLFAFALGCDLVNVGTRSDVRHRLHSGAALPHEPLPYRRRDAAPVARARRRSHAEGGAAANYSSRYEKTCWRSAAPAACRTRRSSPPINSSCWTTVSARRRLPSCSDTDADSGCRRTAIAKRFAG